MEYKRFTSADFFEMDKRYRVHFINSLSGFKSVNLCGTLNTQEQTNLSVLSSVIHLGANPALMGMIIRPASVPRHTYENILETGEYTLNHIHEDILVQAHQTSARYDRNISEFQATELTPMYTKIIKAPYVKESFVKIGLKFREKIDITLNNTILVIGEIIEVIFPGEILNEDGYLEIQEANSVTVSGLDAYYNTKKIMRLTYAKPDRNPERL